MTLSQGTRLGSYEIISLVGVGGMGEVYKARDTRLDRIVAVKVLAGHLAGNTAARERFEREAKAVSALNHPNICTLFDVGEQDGQAFLVMEFLDGETLADKLKKGPLSVEESLKMAIPLADALDKAHRAGVIHRDYKPGNIIDAEPGPKITDYGLAKFGAAAQGGLDLSALPTAEKPLTEKGAILGTFQYMAPEQLEGKDTDARTDIWAFGAVLYEMLTGKRAFEGKSQASLIGAILKDDPQPIPELQPLTPPALERTVKKCLAKEPENRWQTAKDLHDELKWIAEGGSEAHLSERVTGAPSSVWRRALAVGPVFLIGAFVAGAAVWRLIRPQEQQRLTRFGIVLPSADHLTGRTTHVVALSPDGTLLVYAANDQLYLRPMAQMEAIPVRGTEGAREPFFSPDGQWLGFYSGGYIKKISISGGAPVTLCAVTSTYGASWSSDDYIVFGEGQGGILRVSGQGGTPEILVKVGPEEQALFPQILPDGRTLLFTLTKGTDWDQAQIVAQSLETVDRRILVEGGGDARYVPTGHLVYALRETLLAVPFDRDSLEVTGGPIPVVENVMGASRVGSAPQFSFSDTGSMVYVPAGQLGVPGTLVWMDRQGTAQPIPDTQRDYRRHPRLSPDGERLAVAFEQSQIGAHIWIRDLERGGWTRLTFEGLNEKPVWSLDGRKIFFTSNRTGLFEIFAVSADGSGKAQQVTTGAYRVPTSLSPDGKILVFRETGADGSYDIAMLRLEGERKPEPVLATEYNEHDGMISPDGRWLAYTTDETGQDEIYVSPFPRPGGKSPVSTDGGTEPMWSPNGRELFYRNGDKMMAAAVSIGPSFTAREPRLLFESPSADIGGPSSNYDVTADGQQFLMIRPEGSAPSQLNVVLNWHQELLEKVPVN